MRDVRIFTRDRHNTRGCMPRHGTEIVTGVELGSSVCVLRVHAVPATDVCPGAIFKFPSETRPTKFGSFGRDTERMILLLSWV